jgi:hypothetical protein
MGREWCKGIVYKLHDWESDDIIEVLINMLVMKPRARASVSAYLEKVLQIPVRSFTPTPASYRRPQYVAAFNKKCKTKVPYDYTATSRHETTGPLDYAALEECHASMAGWFRDSEIDRYINHSLVSDAPTVLGKREMLSPLPSTLSRKRVERRRREHEASTNRSMPSAAGSELNLFGDGWLKDPNCVGSSVVGLFNSNSEWSSWTTQSLGAQDFEANAPVALDVNEIFVEAAIRRELAQPYEEEALPTIESATPTWPSYQSRPPQSFGQYEFHSHNDGESDIGRIRTFVAAQDAATPRRSSQSRNHFASPQYQHGSAPERDSRYETMAASPEMKENSIADEADEDEGEDDEDEGEDDEDEGDDDEDEDELEIETFMYPDGYTKYVFNGMWTPNFAF